MNRALFWKEWREQRPIVIAGLGLALVMPFVLAAGASSVGSRADLAAMSALMPLVMWPLLAVACGASTISGEIGDGTLGFLLSRPASRLRVWLVKVATALLAMLVIVAGSLAVAAILLVVARGADRVGAPKLEFGDALELLPVAGGLLLLFACSVFFSTFLSRAMTAAAAGLVTALVIGAAVVLVWQRLDLVPSFEQELIGLELGAAGLLVLLASLWIFTAGELLSGRQVLRHALLGGLAALGITLVASAPVVLARTRLDPDSAQLSDIRLVPGRNAVVATAHREHGTSPEVWLIHLDGSGIERLTGRLAGWPSVSPDGRFVAYVSVRGLLGLRSDDASLHVVSLDEGKDRVLVPKLPGANAMRAWDEIRWAPDGDRLAVVYGSSLFVAALDGSSTSTFSLAERSELPRFPRLAGFSPDGNEVLLVTPNWQRDEPMRLVAYDPGSERVRELFSTSMQRVFSQASDRSVADMFLLLLGQPSDVAAGQDWSYSIVGVSGADGTTQTLLESPCLAGFDLSADAETLVYGACSQEDPKRGPVQIRFRDRSSGTEHATPPLVGRPWEMHLSPGGDWVAMARIALGAGPLPAAAVRSDGTMTEFEGPWAPLGWTGRSGVVLAEASDSGFRSIAVGDAASGDVRVVFP